MPAGKVYVKVQFHMKVQAKDLTDAMAKARQALLSQQVTFDVTSKDPHKIIAYDGEMSDDSDYISEPILEE